ncbi:uncharacterized protein PpBr36_09989 [Pyricularia pennisetigena]|uniref:uncharacterized protein n=1 Tax=Pyricularia pennisetigena TaxID=1578925 RepID=UPI00114D7BDB|nr:uncharacterized protein PpBr36_09989 [Pyricularia pennisetigena]TLS22180.1 hypothetical protein PpBr36_09989 [Pyricularia pennisetigena]
MVRYTRLVCLISGFCTARARVGGVKDSQSSLRSEGYDYVIVGGGTSGLVLANRLSADPTKTVLVVEYGDFERSNKTSIPLLTTGDQSSRLYQNMTSTPQRELAGRTFNARIGNTVGGSSTVNGMAWDCGSAADYDAWEALGNPGWGWDGLRPYLRKSAVFTPPGDNFVKRYNYTWTPEAYGDDGMVNVTLPPWQWPASAMQAAAWTDDLNEPLRHDGAGGNNVGISWLPQNSDVVEGTRSTSTTAYYDPIRTRDNLDLLVRHYGGRILFDGDQAVTGVTIHSRDEDYSPSDGPVVVQAKEVILATGAINTPRLLQLSGIGHASHLESMGIHVVADLPGVGANFQDHPAVFVIYDFVNDTNPNPRSMQENATFRDAAWAEYRANRTGPLSHAWGNKIVFQSLQDLVSNPQEVLDSIDRQDALAHLPAVYADNTSLLAGFLAQRAIMRQGYANPEYGIYEITFGGDNSIVTALQKPLSRGTITITNTTVADPSTPPIIDYASLSNPVDVRMLVQGVARVRQFMAAPSVVEILKPVELIPGPGADDPVSLEAILRKSMVIPSFDHPVGTAAMAPYHLGGVVDSKTMAVYGVSGLRVVDASIMPLLPAAHTQWTVYAVAEKAAELILKSTKVR